MNSIFFTKDFLLTRNAVFTVLTYYYIFMFINTGFDLQINNIYDISKIAGAVISVIYVVIRVYHVLDFFVNRKQKKKNDQIVKKNLELEFEIKTEILKRKQLENNIREAEKRLLDEKFKKTFGT